MTAALELIKQCEGCKLEAYLCPAGVWTCGWGSTAGVTSDTVWTQEQADSALCRAVEKVRVQIGRLVQVPLTESQLDALTSFVYNIGIGAFQTSTMLKLINQGKHEEAIKEFARWNKAAGKVLPGLVERRKLETELYQGVQQ